MTLRISIQQSRITMELIGNKRVVDSEMALYYHNLDDLLITVLDKLLKRNSIDTTALNSFKILGNTGKNSTSYKVAAVFIEGLRVKV